LKASKGRRVPKRKTIQTIIQLAAGAKAPAFALLQDGGGAITLADFAGRKLVLYFYPRADTPGCTQEAMDFSRLKGAFARANTVILGVSGDPVSAQVAFKSKYKLSIALASDEKHRMLEAYGVWQQKSMYGRTFMGIVRTTFLIGTDRRIIRVWPKVSVAGHAQEVLDSAKTSCNRYQSIYPSRQNANRNLPNINHAALKSASWVAGLRWPSGVERQCRSGQRLSRKRAFARHSRSATPRAGWSPGRGAQASRNPINGPATNRNPVSALRTSRLDAGVIHSPTQDGRSGSDRWRSGLPSAASWSWPAGR
jgi:thioredoxin-dependent peroxiredoxin